jgi:hypothetical protein
MGLPFDPEVDRSLASLGRLPGFDAISQAYACLICCSTPLTSSGWALKSLSPGVAPGSVLPLLAVVMTFSRMTGRYVTPRAEFL